MAVQYLKQKDSTKWEILAPLVESFYYKFLMDFNHIIIRFIRISPSYFLNLAALTICFPRKIIRNSFVWILLINCYTIKERSNPLAWVTSFIGIF